MLAASLAAAAPVAAQTQSRRPVVLDNNGRLLVASSYTTEYIVVRMLADGTVDKSYGESGTGRWPRPHLVSPVDISLDAAGGLVFLSSSELVRFTPEGKPDLAFGAAGVVKLSTSAHDLAAASGSDKLIVAGNSSLELILQRFMADGKPDASFGTNGMFRTERGGSEPIIAVRPDGGLFVATTVVAHRGSKSRQILVLTLTRDGRIDTAWGYDGFVFLAWSPQANVSTVPLLLHATADGSVLVAGHMDLPGGQAWAFARLTPAGLCDEAWGERGLVLTASAVSTYVERMEVVSDGKIIAAGTTFTSGGSGSEERPGAPGAYLARFLPDGGYDLSFANGGQAAWTVGGADLSLTGVVESERGSLFASGYSTDGGRYVFQFTPTGAVGTIANSRLLKPATLYRFLRPNEVAARDAACHVPTIVGTALSDREAAVAASDAAGAAREPAFRLFLDRLRSTVKAHDLVFWRALVSDLKGTAATGWETAWDSISVTYADYYSDRLAYDPAIWAELEQVLAASPSFRHTDTITEVGLTAASGKGYARFRSAGDSWKLESLHLPGDDYQSAIAEQKRVRPEGEVSAMYATCTESRVRVREAPDLQGKTLGYLEKSDLLEVLEKSAEEMKVGEMYDYWYRVRRLSDNLTGWSYGRYLELEPGG